MNIIRIVEIPDKISATLRRNNFTSINFIDILIAAHLYDLLHSIFHVDQKSSTAIQGMVNYRESRYYRIRILNIAAHLNYRNHLVKNARASNKVYR